MAASFHRLRLTALGLLAAGLLAGVAACSESTPPPPPPEPAVKSPAERAAWYQQCWQQFNDKAWDQFQNCYTETAMSEQIDAMPGTYSGRAAIIQNDKDGVASFPDRRGNVTLVLANGDHVASIAIWTATNTGDLPPGPDGKPMPPTGKSVGLPMAHTGELNATGTALTREAVYFDDGTMMSQLGLSPAPARPVATWSGGPAMVVITKNDDTEKANLATTQAMFDVLNKHDLKGVESHMADDYKGITVAAPADTDKKQSLAGTKEMLGAFPDVKILPMTTWAAGDYVVVAGTFDGTNTGDMPSAKMKKTGNKVSARFLEIFKFSGGKVQEDWLFYNGAAMMNQLMPAAKK